MCPVLLVKLVRCDLQNRCQLRTRGVVDQKINGADVLQADLRGLPVCQVDTHRGDGRTLGRFTNTKKDILVKR